LSLLLACKDVSYFPLNLVIYLNYLLKTYIQVCIVADTCNLSYIGGGDGEDRSSRSDQIKSS
jgi:hypothetical protein